MGLAAVSAANAHPRLKTGVVVRRIATREDDYVMVKDSTTQSYYKFEPEYEDLLLLMDGSRTAEEIAEEYTQKNPQRPVDEAWVVEYADGLRSIDLIERSERERHLVMMDKLKMRRQKRFYDAERSSLFQILIPMFDPNQMMDRVMPWIRWVWSPWFVFPWIAVFAVLLVFLFRHWGLYWEGFFDLWNFKEKTLGGWVTFFAFLIGVSIWHELGHGFTTKRFGGEVHDIGFMIFYFQPAFYCNIDDSYLFTNRAHRLYATFGGPYFELMLASVATAVWLLTPAESWLHHAALTAVFFSGLSVIVLNINPLLKLDGYYLLMDWLDVPNLREESFDYVGGAFKRAVLRLEVPETPISRRRRRIYLVYGTAAILYTATIMVVIYHLLERWFVGWLGPAGYVALILFFVWILRRRARTAGKFAKHLWLDKREWLGTATGKATAAAVGLLLLASVAILPLPMRVGGVFEVEAGEQAVVRAPGDGIVEAVEVRDGDRVQAGAVIARLASPELSNAAAVAAADAEAARRDAMLARASMDPAAASDAAERLRSAEARAKMIRERRERLNVVAPFAGIVAGYRVEESVGRRLAEGDEICSIIVPETVRLGVRMSERDVQEVVPGTRVRVRAEALAGTTLRSSVRDVSPQASAPPEGVTSSVDLVRRVHQVRVLVDIDNPQERLRPGMSGEVQFELARRSFAGQVWWRFSRWISTVVW